MPSGRKRAVDIAACVVLFPVFALSALFLLVLNPILNRGPLFYRQERMGHGCRPFRVWKFRTMVPAAEVPRGPFDPLDSHRITPLGRWLRRMRIDELPQILNILRGEMSLIGPRPDFYDHALRYLDSVHRYRDRHAVLPGITGLAQTEVGYVDGLDGIRRKVAADLYYVRRSSPRLDLWIAWRTFCIVLLRRGS